MRDRRIDMVARMGAMIAAIAARSMPEWHRNISHRRTMPRLTPVPHRTGEREVGRYRMDDRGICHRIKKEVLS